MKRKNVLITGASRGIGRAIAIAFSKAGYNIGINYINDDKAAKETLNLILSNNVDADIFKYDISNPKSAKELSNAFINRFGKIDVLVNNAGIALNKTLSETLDKEWERVINTNLSSVFYLSKSLLPYFINQQSGSIINISSVWGEVGASCEVAYSASKAGLIGFSKALAKELAPSGIRVNSISPGVIETDMNSNLTPDDINALREEILLGKIGKPENIADVVVFLASDKAEYITGVDISVNGGFYIT